MDKTIQGTINIEIDEIVPYNNKYADVSGHLFAIAVDACEV